MKKIFNPEKIKFLFDKETWLYGRLLLRPAYLAIGGAALWYLIYRFIDLRVSYADVAVFESLLSILGVAHGLIAAIQIQKVNSQHQKIRQAIATGNKKMFIEYTCIRMSPVIKLLLFVFSVIFFVIFIFFPFREAYTGVIAVSITIFILYLLWEVAAELDDYKHGVWKITEIEVREAFKGEIPLEGPHYPKKKVGDKHGNYF